MDITLQDARRLAIAAQSLDGGWKLPAGKEGVARAIERLGVVQIDTIAVIERAHHHTLWTRRADYEPEMLHDLLAVDRRVFEYWATPAAGYVPMCDYRWYLPRMRRARESDRDRKWGARYSAEMKHVLEPSGRRGRWRLPTSHRPPARSVAPGGIGSRRSTPWRSYSPAANSW